MKKINKLILTMLAVFAMAIILKLPVDAAVRQIGATENSITIEWDTPNLTSGSTILGFTITTSSTAPSKDYASNYPIGPNVRSYTIGGQVPNAAGYYYVHCRYRSSTGSIYTTYQSAHVNSLPSACTSATVTQSRSNQVAFKSPLPTNSNRLAVQIYRNGKLICTTTGYTTAYFNISKNVVYSYRVAYTYSYGSGPTWTGAWSPMRKFCVPSLAGTTKSNKKGIKITLRRTAGVTKYLLQTSRNRDSGYRNAKTIGMGKKSKKTFQLKKRYYKRAYTYMKVRGYIAGYGWSDCSAGYYIYVYK